MKAVLDASAVLAYVQDEPGSEKVEAAFAGSVISSVNWAEVVQKSIAGGVNVDGMREDMEALGLAVFPFTPEDAEVAARLWPETKPYGLSLSDRACLSLGLRLEAPVLTTDLAWASLVLSIPVQVIR